MTRVREGVKQTFERVDMDLKGGEGAVEEVEKRLAFFTKKVSWRQVDKCPKLTS